MNDTRLRPLEERKDDQRCDTQPMVPTFLTEDHSGNKENAHDKARNEHNGASPRTIGTKSKSATLLWKIRHPLTGTRTSYTLGDFEVGPLLGSGKYGRVYRAKDLVRKKTVALKLIDMDQIEQDSFQQQIVREIEIQGNLHHDNIIQLFGFFIRRRTVYIVLEFAPQGSLYDQLQKDGCFNEQTVAEYLRVLTQAVCHLHGHGVLHRDIKPENVLLGEHGEVKLADFGWSLLHRHGRCKTLCGTVEYLAPEMISGEGYDGSIDVWSLGVLSYELLFGHTPFIHTNHVRISKRIKKAQYTFPSAPVVSETAKDFISAILVRDSRKRISLRGMLSHPFLKVDKKD